MAEGIPKKQLTPFVQAGTDVASAGSVMVIEFDHLYNSAPVVVVSPVGGIAAQPTVSVSGASVNCVTASASGSWVAYGN